MDRPLSKASNKTTEAPLKEEPTYQMQPHTKPTYEKYKGLIVENLKKHLDTVLYDQNDCLNLSKLVFIKNNF